MKIKAVIWQEDDVWCGSVPAMPGCHTWGESYEQLLEMLKDAVQGWLEVASQHEDLEPEKQLIELSLCLPPVSVTVNRCLKLSVGAVLRGYRWGVRC